MHPAGGRQEAVSLPRIRAQASGTVGQRMRRARWASTCSSGTWLGAAVCATRRKCGRSASSRKPSTSVINSVAAGSGRSLPARTESCVRRCGAAGPAAAPSEGGTGLSRSRPLRMDRRFTEPVLAADPSDRQPGLVAPPPGSGGRRWSEPGSSSPSVAQRDGPAFRNEITPDRAIFTAAAAGRPAARSWPGTGPRCPSTDGSRAPASWPLPGSGPRS